jgi:Uma2 family endonuclease
MATEATSLLTFTEMVVMLEANPHESRRHELIDGVLYVTPSPFNIHGWAVVQVSAFLWEYARSHGGMALAGGGLYYNEYNYVEPDVLFLGRDHPDVRSRRYTTRAPDIAVEVSSDSTRRRDLTIKRRLYEQTGVGEYWFVDLRDERLLVHRQDPGYDRPLTLAPGDTLTTPLLAGLAIPVTELVDFPD